MLSLDKIQGEHRTQIQDWHHVDLTFLYLSEPVLSFVLVSLVFVGAQSVAFSLSGSVILWVAPRMLTSVQFQNYYANSSNSQGFYLLLMD